MLGNCKISANRGFPNMVADGWLHIPVGNKSHFSAYGKFQSLEHSVSRPGTPSFKAWNTQFQRPGTPSFKGLKHPVSRPETPSFKGLEHPVSRPETGVIWRIWCVRNRPEQLCRRVKACLAWIAMEDNAKVGVAK